MEIQGDEAYLRPEEQVATGLGSPIAVEDIDLEALENRLADALVALQDRQAADDELLPDERARLNIDAVNYERRCRLVAGVSSKVLQHRCNVNLDFITAEPPRLH